MRRLFCVLVLTVGLTHPCDRASANTGWSPQIIATGEFREQLQATPIEHRPNRPLHFYGNAVRRNYHRGNANARPFQSFSRPFTTIRGTTIRSTPIRSTPIGGRLRW